MFKQRLDLRLVGVVMDGGVEEFKTMEEKHRRRRREEGAQGI